MGATFWAVWGVVAPLVDDVIVTWRREVASGQLLVASGCGWVGRRFIDWCCGMEDTLALWRIALS
jgi:hypothetical protein